MRLIDRARNLRYGFLLTPLLIAISFAGLALLLVELDRSAGVEGVDIGFSNGAEAGRSLLSTIAGSLITVAGLTFSIMIVTLQLVSQQFSPRSLRTFVGDRFNQFVGGYFIGVFVYCLLVLRTVESEGVDDVRFVPSLSIGVAILLALGALALLLAFIDHMAQRIQVSTIAGNVTRETLSSIDNLYPEMFGRAAADDGAAELAAWRGSGMPEEIRPKRPGYVQSVRLGDGVGRARVHVPVAPGDFVTECDLIAEVWPDGQGDPVAELERAIVVADEREISQDAGFGIRQISDIALRALSPSLNDPTTAVTCISYLRAIMERLAVREFPARLRRQGETTILARRATWDGFVEIAFAEVARHAADPRVADALLGAIAAVGRVAEEAGASERLPALAGVAERVAATADPAGPTDAARIAAQAEQVASLGRSR